MKSRSLRIRFYAQVLISIALPMMLMAALTVGWSYKTAHDQIIADNSRLTALLASMLKDSIRASERRLQSLARMIDRNVINRDDVAPAIRQNRSSNPEFTEIRILAKNGTVRVVSPYNADVVGSDMSNSPIFKTVRNSKGVTWSTAYLSTTSGKPVASLAVPFANGVIAVNYDFIKLRNSVNDLVESKGLTVEVIDSSGTFLAHTSKAMTATREWSPHAKLFRSIASGLDNQTMITLEGSKALATATSISETGWTLVVLQKIDPILAPVYRMAQIFLLCSLLIFLLSAGVVISLSSNTFNFMQQLADNIRLVARGKEPTPTQHGGYKELRDVDDDFFRMSDEITLREKKIEALNRELQARLDEAQSANDAKSEFLANMSHELRTPLNGALGMLQLLSVCGINEEQQEYVDSATRSLRNLTTLLNDILDLSRIEAGRMDMIREPFPVSELFSSLDDIFGDMATSKDISLELAPDPTLPEYLDGDVLRIKQILFNLVGNALKFTNEGSVYVTATPIINNATGQQLIMFTVADTGIGIPAAKLATIFEPFTQVEGAYTRHFQGAGLGLSIVKRLLDLMDGSACIHSEPDAGTTVHFALPLASISPDDAKA